MVATKLRSGWSSSLSYSLTASRDGVNIVIKGVMVNRKSDFIVICTVQGELAANVIKSHLESEGIPVMLEYESAGALYGITVNGLGAVRLLVPQKLAGEAKRIIEPKDFGQDRE